MARRLPLILAAGAGFGLAAMAGAAQAGGCTSGCKPPPPCCNVPTTHQVTVPGITVTPPSVSIQTPSIAVAGASASASAYAAGSAQGAAQSSGVVFATGGGSGFYVDQGSTGLIQNLNVEGMPGKLVCVSYKRAFRATAIQAVCLDDKAVPHPASQVTPERELADGYQGEVFRCIAGARMQYTTAEWADGAASFDHGQTHACAKGEALFRSAAGELQCRPQSPARDCNERSLLRRYGAGIKVVKAQAKEICSEWRSIAQTAVASQMLIDGGVGGVVH